MVRPPCTVEGVSFFRRFGPRLATWIQVSGDLAVLTGERLAAAADELATAVAATSTTKWLSLSQQRSRWTMQTLPVVAKAPESARVSLLACASLSCAGRVRQQAVELLGASGAGTAVRYLVPRLVDWVPEVRG
jgi:hypothetical protein